MKGGHSGGDIFCLDCCLYFSLYFVPNFVWSNKLSSSSSFLHPSFFSLFPLFLLLPSLPSSLSVFSFLPFFTLSFFLIYLFCFHLSPLPPSPHPLTPHTDSGVTPPDLPLHLLQSNPHLVAISTRGHRGLTTRTRRGGM